VKANHYAVQDLLDRRRLSGGQLVGERSADAEPRAVAARRRLARRNASRIVRLARRPSRPVRPRDDGEVERDFVPGREHSSALYEMEKGRSVHGADLVETLRVEALVALFSGKFAPARARLEEVSRLSSQAIGDTYLALAYFYSGSSERGRTMLEALATHPSASTSARAGAALAGVLAAQGVVEAARLQLERVLRSAYRDHHVAYGLGAAYAQLGDIGQATHWLRIAADTGFPCVPWFDRDPLLDPVRRRAEYPELLTYVRARREASLSRMNQ
jgi:tetratricopeptide (TPR) repeat protein